jgi:hypothetical protein
MIEAVVNVDGTLAIDAKPGFLAALGMTSVFLNDKLSYDPKAKS